jgi:hypothetical protein
MPDTHEIMAALVADLHAQRLMLESLMVRRPRFAPRPV